MQTEHFYNEIFIPESMILAHKNGLPQSQAITASRFMPSNSQLKHDYDDSVREYFPKEYPGVSFPDFLEIRTIAVTLEDYDGENYIYSHEFTF